MIILIGINTQTLNNNDETKFIFKPTKYTIVNNPCRLRRKIHTGSEFREKVDILSTLWIALFKINCYAKVFFYYLAK